MNIVIFGIGCVYLKKKKYFFNDNIVAYIDNNDNLVGSSIDGICVHKVENIKELTYDYIIPMSLDTKNMIAQLLQYGVDADKILLKIIVQLDKKILIFTLKKITMVLLI